MYNQLINKCYCINREEAFKLHNELLKFNMNVSVNKLYTTRDLKKDHDFDNFCVLTKQKFILKSRMIKQLPKKLRFIMKPRRYLGLCIPGLALHLEKTYMKPNDYTRFNIPQ